MDLAFKEAEKAFKQGEVPIGTVIVKNGKILAKTHNIKEKTACAVNHAEILAILKASKKINKTYIDLSHMDIEYIKITQEEYNKLVEKYTEELVNKKLIDMESYEANRKKKYIDHYKALCSWLNKEKSKEQHIKSIDKAKYDDRGFKIIE